MPATSGTEARNGPKKRPMKIPNAPLLHKGFTARNEVGMARQRPVMGDGVFELEPDPIRQPVAERGAERGRDPYRPEADAARPDQRADRHQRAPGRDQQRDEG